jgi:hypothetical protein
MLSLQFARWHTDIHQCSQIDRRHIGQDCFTSGEAGRRIGCHGSVNASQDSIFRCFKAYFGVSQLDTWSIAAPRQRGNEWCVDPQRTQLTSTTRRSKGLLSARQDLAEKRGIVGAVLLLSFR